jgi:hypothetical protein
MSNGSGQLVDASTTTPGGGVYLEHLPGDKVKICNPTPAMLDALKRIGEDDPAICFDWNPVNLKAAVDWANQHRPPLPPWYGAGAGVYPITEVGVQQGLVGFLAQAGSGIWHGTFLLAPNNLIQSFGIQQRMTHLMLADAFLLAICGQGRAPLATVYVIYDRKHNTMGVRLPMLPLPPVPGVQVFE